MVELKKDLPEIFEEFADQRRNSFLAIKKLKEQGVPVVGAFCTYLPKELPRAMGAAVVGLCSVSDETIPDAEKDLPRNLCPLIKSSYGFAKTDKCPFFYFSDLVVGETTCDGKKKMYEMLADFKPVYVIELPNRQSEEGIAMYRREIIRFKEELERRFETTITEEAIRHEIHLNNEITKSLLRLQYLMANDPAPVSGLNIVNTAYGSGFNMDVESLPARINDLADQIEAEYAAGKNEGKKPRILVTGSPSGGAALKVIRAIEDAGAVVVAFENCSGLKSMLLTDEENPDVYDALARRYLGIGCSCMSPNPNRLAMLDKLIDEFHVVFGNEQGANFFDSAWRQFRKRGAYPTAITQNCEYLLNSPIASMMLSNSECTIMLSQAASDRQELAKLLHISDDQMSYCTNTRPGCGLLKYGSALVPFINDFPENTRLYQLMTTKLGEGVFGGGGDA